jgi:hypothetical protein
MDELPFRSLVFSVLLPLYFNERGNGCLLFPGISHLTFRLTLIHLEIFAASNLIFWQKSDVMRKSKYGHGWSSLWYLEIPHLNLHHDNVFW